jgi:hypothetical protein
MAKKIKTTLRTFKKNTGSLTAKKHPSTKVVKKLAAPKKK